MPGELHVFAVPDIPEVVSGDDVAVMIGDALARLKFGTVESYQYVGLGSVYFSDFVL